MPARPAPLLTQVEVLQDFYKMLAEDPGRAFYGPGHVFAAAELGAIQTLMIADSLFRINDVGKRARYVALVDSVADAGGEALVFSSMHVSGEQLGQLTGIAAILRFPLDEMADEDIPAPF
jgi:protein pelota